MGKFCWCLLQIIVYVFLCFYYLFFVVRLNNYFGNASNVSYIYLKMLARGNARVLTSVFVKWRFFWQSKTNEIKRKKTMRTDPTPRISPEHQLVCLRELKSTERGWDKPRSSFVWQDVALSPDPTEGHRLDIDRKLSYLINQDTSLPRGILT